MESGVSIIAGFHCIMFEDTAVCRVHISSRREINFQKFFVHLLPKPSGRKSLCASIPPVEVDQSAIQK